jgi:hypothetical protein
MELFTIEKTAMDPRVMSHEQQIPKASLRPASCRVSLERGCLNLGLIFSTVVPCAACDGISTVKE